MKIARLTLQHFTRHAASVVELPERGLVLVTGSNGSGKSSLYDAIAWAVWGETVRGRSPVPSTRPGTTRVEVATADGLVVDRARRGGKTSLTWASPAVASDHGTVTKAEEALHATTGSFERWRRTHVFTLRDPWSFATASDRDRKVFLERLLGLERFDGALEGCRADLRAVAARHQQAAAAVAQESLRADGAARRVADVAEYLASMPPEPDTAATTAALARLRGMVREAAEELQEAEEAERREELRVVEETTRRRVEAEGLQKRLALITQSGACSTCGAALPPGRREEMERALHAAEVLVVPPTVALGDLRERTLSAREEHRLLRERVVRADAELSAAHGVQRQRAAAEKTRAAAEEEQRAAEGRLAAAAAAAEQLQREVRELEAVERVLGLRGVRASVLGDALGGLEAVANTWLARLGMPDLRLRLAATSTRASGAVVDAISVDVDGAADGQGYQGASGGERTRFDLALMLALADIAGGLVAGSSGGTLWFDEVLDTLDASGVEAVVGLLEELSAERPVVVISHAVDLIERLHPSAVLRLRVDDGSVREG